MGADLGSKELLNRIGEKIWSDAGAYSVHTTFIREMYGQKRVNL